MRVLTVLVLLVTLAFAGAVPRREANSLLRWYEVSGSGRDSANPHRERMDVYIQDQTTENISLFLAESLSTDVTLNLDAQVNDDSVVVSSPTVVPLVGNFFCFKESTSFAQMELIGVTSLGGDDYECDIGVPLDFAFTTSARICLQNCDMNVDGSVTPVHFMSGPEGLDSTVRWDITRMMVSMYHSSQGDDGLFGNLPSLTNGTYFRVANGAIKNLFNARENADFRTEGYDVDYSARSGGQGSAGTAARLTFAGPDKRGVTLRLEAASDDVFRGVVRDDIDALDYFRVKIQGHVVD